MLICENWEEDLRLGLEELRIGCKMEVRLYDYFLVEENILEENEDLVFDVGLFDE